MSKLSLALLGNFRAVIDGNPLTHFGSNKVQALLIYLTTAQALNSNGEMLRHQRETLMELLWPGLLPKSAQNNLRQTIYKLRQLIPFVEINNGRTGEFLISKRQTLQLNPDAIYNLDIATFTRLIKQSQTHTHTAIKTCPDCQSTLQKAAALYQGEFLSDFYLPDSNNFEDWAWNLRALFRRQVLDVLDTLTLMMFGQGQYNQARVYAEQQLDIDPLHENAHRQIMEILTINGQPGEALSHYKRLQKRLQEEMGMAPMEQTSAIYEQIRAGNLGATTASITAVRGYDIQEVIGSGAFGVVHRARQPFVNRDVAIKIISPALANKPEFIRRFEVEAQLVARLEHPHIVPLYDFWREPDAAYLVMRFLRGGNLEQKLAKGPLSIEKTGRILDQVCAALQVAHQHSIVHRDIKPANILLDEDGNVYLSDFGFAKELGTQRQQTSAGPIVGTPDFISPEQYTDKPVTPASDIYSLGIVLFKMLTGHLPFPNISLSELIYKHLHEQLPRVSGLNWNLPAELDEVIWKATAKKPQGRFPTTLALAAAFNEAIQNQTGIGENVVFPVVPRIEITNPYQGLRPFQETDSDYFYGRYALVEKLLSQLAPTATAPFTIEEYRDQNRFLAVVGPSGSGKSSVVKAGLIPALRRGEIAGSENWFIIEMVPGSHPLEELEAALLQVAVNPPPSLLEPLLKDDRGLIRTLKRVLPPADGDERPQLLLLIDQFEELFTLVEETDTRSHFIASLITALQDSRSQLRLVITLRADFYDRPLQHPALGDLLSQRTEVVLPMTLAELEQAIIRPAAQMGVRMEPGLAATIAADVADQPGALPLLQYTLTELFEHRQNGTMTAESYQVIGGVKGALARRAEALYQSLQENGQATARQLFLRLVTLGKGANDTRRRVLRSELASLAEIGSKQESLNADELDRVINMYARARLITFDRDPITREPTVEVAHEALLREWNRLLRWLEENRNDVRLQHRLATAAAEWEQANFDPGFLLIGSRLDQFASWVDETNLALSGRERTYLAASLAESQAQLADEEARRQQELATARRLADTESQRATEQEAAAGRLRQRAIYLALALVAAILLAIVAGIFSQQSSRNADLAATGEADAIANLALAMTQEAQALLAADERATAQADAEAEADARSTAQADAVRSEQEAIAAGVTAQAETVLRASAEAEAIARQFEAESARRLALAQSAAALSAQIQQQNNDTELASLLAIEAYRINQEENGHLDWLVDSSLRPLLNGSTFFNNTLTGHNGVINSVAFSPDGRWLASGSEDGTVQLWKLGQSDDEPLVLPGLEGGVNAVAFSFDGHWLAAGSEAGTLQLWDLAYLDQVDAVPLVLVGNRGSVNTVAFSEQWLASGSRDGTVQLWNLADLDQVNREPLVLGGHAGSVNAVAFSPNGQLLASGSNDKTVQIWRVTDIRQPGVESIRLTGHNEFVNSIAFSEQRLATGSSDKTVRVWNLADLDQESREPLVFEHNAGVLSVTFSPDGHRLVSGTENWVTTVRNLEQEGQEVAVLTGQEGAIQTLDYSFDGKMLATGSLDGTVRVWDLGQIDPVFHVLTGEDGTFSVAYSPNGQQLASGSEDGTVQLWNLEQLETTSQPFTGHNAWVRVWDSESTGFVAQRLLGHSDWVRSVAFNPDGRHFASGSRDGTVRIWDIDDLGQDGGDPLILTDFEETVWSVAYSPNGQWLAVGSGDGKLYVWNTADLGQVEVDPLILIGHSDAVRTVTFSPEGKWLASGSWDNTIRVWDTADFGQPATEALILSGHEDHVLSLAFSPDSKYLASGSKDNTVRVWDLTDPGQNVVTASIFAQHRRGVTSVAFSPDGQRLASGSEDTTIRVWDWRHNDASSLILAQLSSQVWSVAYSPDGRWLASSGGDPALRLWLLLDHLIEIGCQKVWRNLTWIEWQQYFPGEPYRQTCPNLPSHPSVPAEQLD